MLMNQLQGKQFRGLRSRNGKLINNRVGGYERSRGDDSYNQRRRDRLQRALIADERESTFEVFEDLQQRSTPRGCVFAGQPAAVPHGLMIEESDDFDSVLVVRYHNGRMLSAHTMSYAEALRLQD